MYLCIRKSYGAFQKPHNMGEWRTLTAVGTCGIRLRRHDEDITLKSRTTNRDIQVPDLRAARQQSQQLDDYRPCKEKDAWGSGKITRKNVSDALEGLPPVKEPLLESWMRYGFAAAHWMITERKWSNSFIVPAFWLRLSFSIRYSVSALSKAIRFSEWMYPDSYLRFLIALRRRVYLRFGFYRFARFCLHFKFLHLFLFRVCGQCMKNALRQIWWLLQWYADPWIELSWAHLLVYAVSVCCLCLEVMFWTFIPDVFLVVLLLPKSCFVEGCLARCWRSASPDDCEVRTIGVSAR